MTKKQKIKFIALLTTTASLAVGSYFFKKKVEKMKEDDNVNIKFTKMDRLIFTNLDRII